MASLKPESSRLTGSTLLGHAGSHQDDMTEQTPLLAGQIAPDGDTEASALLGDRPPKQSAEKPFPKLQIFLLCCLRIPESVTFFSIFPFIAQMVQRNGNLPEADVGFYSGLIESLFSAVQMLVVIFWGRLADRIGRKPVLLYSFAGLSVSPMLFGLSTSLWQMILFRCIAGVFSGSTLVVRTMVAEQSSPATQAKAFSWHAFGGHVGIFLGPVIGGALANPAVQYPRVFKGVHFFEDYPYALAGFVVGALSLACAIMSAFFIEETLVSQSDVGNNAGSSNGQDLNKPMPIRELVKAPGVGASLWVYSHAMFLAFAFTAVMPVALYIRPELGGIGFSPSEISIYMAIQGGSQAAWLLLVFPHLQHRIGTRGVLQCCGIVWPFFFASYVILNALLRDGTEPAMIVFWTLGVLLAVVGPGVAMAFTGAQLALNDVSPNPQVLGTLNGIALTLSSGIRAVVPGVASAIYSIGARNHILYGQLAWAILIPIALAFYLAASLLPNRKNLDRESTDDETT